MRDHTSERTLNRMPAGRVISMNIGPSRKTRRHADLESKEGQLLKRNKPYINKNK